MKISIQMNFFDGSSSKFEVAKKRFVIGRSEKADVVVAKEGFSREHCLVEYEDDGFHITDLGSTNGVRINNRELPKKIKTHYDSFLPLSIGFAESVILEVSETSRVAAPTPMVDDIKKKARREDSTPTGEFKPGQIKSQGHNQRQVKKESNAFAIKLVFIVIVAAAFVVYFFMNKEGAIDGEFLPSTPSKSNNKSGSDYIEF